ncbi:MAG: hypothetical protein GF364_03445 [Candidatus Lokiarchaeota archaeon]|nr:hypothetical protein [Candidatus Lokiarchaeota archaeon]
MSIRFYKPPKALLSKGGKEGSEIGGALIILGMDQDLNFHTVRVIFAELSWGEFMKEKGYETEYGGFSVIQDDTKALWDKNELIARLVEAFEYIIKKNWIFFGIADFESNSFQSEMLIEGLDYKYILRLMNQHKKIRDEGKFPVLIDKKKTKNKDAHIATKFNGQNYNYFHYTSDTDLFMIFNKLNDITGNVAGIVCTSQGAANFYILSQNIHKKKDSAVYHIDTKTLEDAFTLMTKNVIFPISWYKINLGLNSLKSLEKWQDIKDDKRLKMVLYKYFSYAKKKLRKQHQIRLQKKKKKTQNVTESIDYETLTEDQKDHDLKAMEDILESWDLRLFNPKLKEARKKKQD